MTGRVLFTLLLVVIVIAGLGPATGAVEANESARSVEMGPVNDAVGSNVAMTGDADAKNRATVAPPVPGLQQVDADTIGMQVALRANGDAKWTVTYRVRLETDNDTAAFRTLQEDVANNPENYTSRFADRMRQTAAGAENATGREMAINNVTISTDLQDSPPRYGVVTYRFRWTNFAVVEGDQLRAGDAITGLYIDDRTRLTMTWPTEFERTTVTPSPDESRDHAVVWDGPVDFGSDAPRLVVTRSGPLSGQLPLLVLGGVILVILIALVVLGRSGRLPLAGWGDAGRSTGESSTGERHVDSGADTGVVSSDSAEDVDDEPPPELLSNEERVLRLVADHGGRVKQQELVEGLEWTEAKTSQVVSDLRDAGDLEGFRLGRENVLKLPDDEADDTEFET